MRLRSGLSFGLCATAVVLAGGWLARYPTAAHRVEAVETPAKPLAPPPDTASAVLSFSTETRLDAAAAALLDAAEDPLGARRLAEQLCRADPVFVREHGDQLIAVLSGAGEFRAAVAFADAGGPERSEWLARALTAWAEQEPAAAAEAALALPDGEGFTEVARVWAARDSAGLAEFATRMSRESERAPALALALNTWLARDPAAAAAWLAHLPPDRNLDPGTAMLATTPQLLGTQPDIAWDWAKGIVDPELRRATLAAVATAWAKADPTAARLVAETSAGLPPSDREVLFAALNRPPD